MRNALRRGRVLLWYPDLYDGAGQPDIPVGFLDHVLFMSRALPKFCRAARVLAVPCMTWSIPDDPVLHTTFGEPIEPPRREIDDTAYLQGLCSFYDDALRDADAVIEWAGWEDVAVCEAESAPN